MFLYHFLKSFSFSKYLNFCLDFLVMQEERLNKRAKVNFKIYDVKTWFIHNLKTYISQ